MTGKYIKQTCIMLKDKACVFGVVFIVLYICLN